MLNRFRATPGRRPGPPAYLVCALALLVLGRLPPSPAWGAEDGVTVEPREKCSDVFGGKEVDVHLVVKAPRALTGRVGWTFSTTNRRTIASGDVGVTASPDRPGTATVRLRVPEVREGVVLRAQLTAAVFGDGDKEPLATHDRPVWIFPNDPFAGRKEWLKDLKISLFDPEKTTAEAFRKLEIPFEEVTNQDALGDLKEGLLVVGQGVTFDREHRALPETLVKVAAGGVPVLCLAPAGGVVTLPGADAPRLPFPGSLSFRHQDVITELDKRLDAEGWPPDGRVVAATVTLKAQDNRVVGEVTRDTGGWPWVEASFPDKKSRLVYCGFALLGKGWEAGPAPRFLLARILDFITKKAEDQPAQEKEARR